MKNFFWFFGSMIFIGSLCFMMGSAYKEDKLKIVISDLQKRDVSRFISDNSQRNLEGYVLDIPEEFSQLTDYDDDKLDLLFGYRDDAGDYHLGFTGKQIDRDSLHLDEMDTDDHSELQPIKNDIATPISYK
jgi:hypothetical protein